jgi:hypothetical protein
LSPISYIDGLPDQIVDEMETNAVFLAQVPVVGVKPPPGRSGFLLRTLLVGHRNDGPCALVVLFRILPVKCGGPDFTGHASSRKYQNVGVPGRQQLTLRYDASRKQ